MNLHEPNTKPSNLAMPSMFIKRRLPPKLPRSPWFHTHTCHPCDLPRSSFDSIFLTKNSLRELVRAEEKLAAEERKTVGYV